MAELRFSLPEEVCFTSYRCKGPRALRGQLKSSTLVTTNNESCTVRLHTGEARGKCCCLKSAFCPAKKNPYEGSFCSHWSGLQNLITCRMLYGVESGFRDFGMVWNDREKKNTSYNCEVYIIQGTLNISLLYFAGTLIIPYVMEKARQLWCFTQYVEHERFPDLIIPVQ